MEQVSVEWKILKLNYFPSFQNHESVATMHDFLIAVHHMLI